MKIWNKTQLINRLEKEGLHFSQFSLTHEGNYTTDDADWNYKDVPHLHHIHQLVEATFATMTDKLITTINVQSVFGLKLPLCVVNYESGKNEQTYFTSWLFFVLIVQTKYVELGECKTRVVTTYHVGSPRLLKWCFPLIRFSIKRNYKDLMSGDIPMRERRGKLRSWGYSFHKDTDTYSFPKTMEIMQENALPPKTITEPYQIQINDKLPHNGEYFHGRDDHLGLRLVRKDSELYVFSRMCMHEGASLDSSTCSKEMKLKCPWHGRLHAPLACFKLNENKSQMVKTNGLQMEMTNHLLMVKEIKTHSTKLDCETANVT